MVKFRYVLIACVLAISCLFILYALNLFPLPGTDSRVFIPPAYLLSKGMGFNNPLYDISKIPNLHEAGANPFQFNYYAPFFSLFTGTISKIHPGYSTIFIICALFSVVNLLLYAGTLSKLVNEKTSIIQKVIFVLSIVYVSNFVLPTVGRPEAISTLLIYTLYILYQKRHDISQVVYNISICVLFGLLLTTQIMGFFFGFLFFIIYEVLNSNNIYKTIWINTARFVGVMAIFVIAMSLSPNGFMNTINGIRVHGTWALTRTDRSFAQFFYFWMLAPLSFGFLVISLLCAIVYTRSLIARAKNTTKLQVTLLICLHLIVLYGIPKFILYASPTVYNASQFIFPMMVYLAIAMSSEVDKVTKNSIGIFTGVTYLCGLFLFFRWIFLFVEYKQSGKDYEHAKAVVNQYIHNGEHVYTTLALWPLYEDINHVTVYYDVFPLKKGDLIVLQQANYQDARIEKYLKMCTVVCDWRTNRRATFLGLPLSNSPNSFSFVICRVN